MMLNNQQLLFFGNPQCRLSSPCFHSPTHNNVLSKIITYLISHSKLKALSTFPPLQHPSTVPTLCSLYQHPSSITYHFLSCWLALGKEGTTSFYTTAAKNLTIDEVSNTPFTVHRANTAEKHTNPLCVQDI